MLSATRCPVCGTESSVSTEKLSDRFRCLQCRTQFTPSVEGAETVSTGRKKPVSEKTLKMLGRFRIGHRLGAGAFGTVYHAFDPQLDREIALKVPNAGVLDSPAKVQRFLREAKAAARLRHPNIVPVFDAGQSGTHYYIASAFIQGQTLASSISKEEYSFERAARVARELAAAINYAHEQGIIHRDIKPANIMLDDQDRPHLMDFGLAAKHDELERLTNDGQVIGTPAYMAPEQAAGQKGGAKAASDQYSLGITLYEMLTGAVPFQGQIATVLYHVLHKPPPRPSEHRPGIPVDLETICLKALEKDPSQRYATVGELAEDLRRYESGQPIVARPIGRIEATSRWVKRNPLVTGLAAIIGLVLIMGTLISSGLGLRAWQNARQAEQNAADARAAQRIANEQAEAAEHSRQLADEQAKEAESQRSLADKRATEAEQARLELSKSLDDLKQTRARELEEREKAEKARTDALAQADRAAAAGAVAKKESEKAADFARKAEQALWAQQQSVYAAQIALSQRDWDSGDVRSALKQLNETDPQFRNWEHTFLVSRFGENQVSVPAKPQKAIWGMVSGNGQYLVGFTTQDVLVWDVTKDQEVARFGIQNPFQITCADVSSDGRYLAVGVKTGPIYLFDLTTKQPWCTYKGHPSAVVCLRFAPVGTTLASGCMASTVPQKPLDVRGQQIPQPPLFVPAEVKLWNVRSKGESRLQRQVPTNVADLEFGSDGKSLAFVHGNTLTYWDLTRNQIRTVPVSADKEAIDLAVSPRGDRIAVVTEFSNVISVRTTIDLSEVATLKSDVDAAVRQACFSPNGDTIAAGHDFPDPACCLWEEATGKELIKLRGQLGPIEELRYLADGRLVSCSRLDPDAKLWDLNAPKSALVIPHGSSMINVLEFTSTGKSLFVGDTEGWVKLWNLDSSLPELAIRAYPYVAPLQGPRRPSNGVLAMRLYPDGKKLVTVGLESAKATDFRIKIWDLRTQRLLRFFDTSAAVNPNGLAISSDGSFLAIGGTDGIAHIWNLRENKRVVALRVSNKGIGEIRFHPDDRHLLTADWDGEIKQWDWPAKKSVLFTKDSATQVRSNPCAFSTDGKLMATTGEAVAIHNLATGEVQTSVNARLGVGGGGVCFGPDGKSLASYSASGRSVRLWDLTTGQLLMTQRPSVGLGITYLCSSTRGQAIAAAGGDGRVQIWRIP